MKSSFEKTISSDNNVLISDKCLTCGSEYFPEDNFCRICGAEIIRRTIAEPRFRRTRMDTHYVVGLFLAVFGGTLAVLSFMIGLTPTLAMGLASFLVGLMTLYLPESSGRLAERLANDSSIPALLNLENLLDDLSLNEKGIYLPASGLGVCPKVFIPLKPTPLNMTPPRELNDSRRLFITLDERTREGGILLEPPGKNLLTEMELALKVDFSKVEISRLREKLSAGLMALEISKSLSFDSQDTRTLTFQTEVKSLGELEVRLSQLAPRLAHQVGTLVSSAIAAAVSKSTGEYVVHRHVSINPTEMTLSGTLAVIKQDGGDKSA